MSRVKNTSQYIQEASSAHNYKYDYSLTKYRSTKDKIKIVCPEHGRFIQEASSHLRGAGCPKCVGVAKKDTATFIRQARIVHKRKYYYYKTKYVNSKTKVIITCMRHGDFKQLPGNHINQKNGCKKCAQELFLCGYNESKHFKPFIDNLNDTFIHQYELKYGNKEQHYVLDFYSPELNIVIEYDEKYHKKQIKKDLKREAHIKKLLKCKVIRIDDELFMENSNYGKEILSVFF